MPVSVTFNGTLYNIPASGETGWGVTGTNFLVDLGNNALCLTGTQTVSNKVLTLQNGTAGAPSLAFTADTASGLYQPATSEVAISTGGVQRVLVDSSGVVNILGAPGEINASAGDLKLASTSGAVRAPTMTAGDSSTIVATTAFVATSFAPLASPALTGTPTVPTASGGTNTTQAASTAFVATSFAPLASPALTGSPTAPTQSSADNSTKLATTAFVQTSYAPLASPALTGSPTAPTQSAADNSTKIATTAYVQTATAVLAATDNIGRNKLHNPMMNVAQRGAGPFNTGVYTLDRWSLALSASTASVTQAQYSDANRTSLGDEEAYNNLTAVVGGTSGAGDFAFIWQPIEGVRRLGNKTITVSFWAHATSGTPKLGIGMRQYFGTGGSPSSAVDSNGTSVTLSTTPTRYSTSFTLSSCSGKTLGSANNDYTRLSFWYTSGSTNATIAGSPGVQSATFVISGVQVEIDSSATALEKPDARYDLANCQRFYNAGAIISAGYATTAGQIYTPLAYPVTMRGTPTVAGANNTSTNITSPTAVASAGAPTQVVVGSGTVTATGMYIVNVTYTATADL